jgi:hypothetical protein
MMKLARSGSRRWPVLVHFFIALVILSTGFGTVFAQGVPVPLGIGENQTGQLTEVQPTATFLIAATEAQSVNIAVFAITPGFAPTFRVLDPFGVVLDAPATLGTATAVQSSPVFGGPGVYTIEVSSGNGAFGQFLITAQPGQPVLPPQPLTLGQAVTATLSPQAGRQAYSFAAAQNDVLILAIDSDLPDSGPVVTVRDADTGDVLGVSSGRLGGARFRILRGVVNYIVEVTDGEATAPVPYRICVGSETGVPACPSVSGVPQVGVIPTLTAPAPIIPTLTPIPTQSLPPLPSSGPCIVASSSGGAVNVRNIPTTQGSTVVSQLVGLGTGQVMGRLADGSWYQITVNGLIGWISGSVVRTGGICTSVPIVLPPTAVPPPTVATLAPPVGPTATATATLALPTATATATATTPAAVPTLNFSMPPNFGSTSLTAGFVPDPFTTNITSGGSVNVSYLGGGCTGWATSAPDFSVNYVSGAFTTLRFYFVATTPGQDATLIINGPNSSYSCNDDSFGTLNPTIDFNSPATGRYDVWVGSFAQGTFISGNLFVTENTGNHP